jgi:hypoxanthine phosphoribosyltransferase
MTDVPVPDVLFSAAEIADRVDAMADAIAADLGADIAATPILTGAMIFAADLVRALWRNGVTVELLPIRLRSYGASLAADAPPVLVMPLDRRIDGRTVLIIDGVCDVGHTLSAATAHMREMGAARIASAFIVDKPTRRAASVNPDYVGFTAEDVFVAGYGMDAAGTLRHMPYIGVIRG